MSNNTPAATSLRALSENKTEGITKQTTFRVNPDLVKFEKEFNVRTADDTLDAHIERLYLAMKNGADIPALDVRVEEGKIICVDGHCRTTAGRRMKKEFPDFTLQAREFRGNDKDRVLHMLGTGSGQKALTPLEQGIAFLRLIKFGMTSPQIAEKLGVSRVTVDNGLTLAEAPAEVQEMVRSGDVSSTTAREVVKQGTEAIEALKAAVATEKASPTPTKGGSKSKKKKVTTKKLAGTAAGKKKKSGDKQTKGKKGTINYTIAGVTSEEIVVKLSKADAQATVDFLKANAPEDNKHINSIIGAIELATM